MKVVIIGDVGVVDSYHVGDEAMLEAAIDELRLLGPIDFTVISANPTESAERYSANAVPRVGFGGDVTASRAERDERLRRVIAAAGGHASLLDPDDPAWDVIEAVADSTAVLIAGGGNLTTPFSEHLYERAALAAVAREFGKPLVISGQSLGPDLEARDADLLSEMLVDAALVGVRENESLTTARELGAQPGRLFRTSDDASFLGAADSTDIINRLGVQSGAYAVVSFPDYAGTTDVDEFARELLVALRHMRQYTGLEIVVIPHHGSFDDDAKTHDDIMVERLRAVDGVRVAPLLPAREVAELTRGAALSISGRYHPIVFALGGAVPSIGVWLDLYTKRKIVGVLENVGLAPWAAPVEAVTSGLVSQLVEQTWDRREEISAHLSAQLPGIRERAGAWWQIVHSALGGADITVPATSDPVETLSIAGPLAERLAHVSLTTAHVLQRQHDLVIAARTALLETARVVDAAETESTMTTELHLASADDYRRQIEVLEQALFERERYATAVARALAESTADTNRRVLEAERERDAAVSAAQRRAAEAEAEKNRVIADLKGSTSWRVSLPIRALRHPVRYMKIARNR
jgi:polysaccharide pyruvyl transferase WcaK-like protein